MKRIITIPFLLFWIISYSQTIEFDFTTTFKYKLTYQEDSTNSANRLEIMFDLLVNDKESLFQSSKNVVKDSIYFFHKRELANKIDFIGIAFVPLNKFNYKIVKSNDSIKTYDEVIGTNIDGTFPLYCYKEDKKIFNNWELMGDTLSIGGFLCQKASIHYGGRKWIAYFTTDIPISDGPYTFCGLPGLIMKIHDTKNFWNFDLISSIKHDPAKHTAINFQAKYVPSNVTKAQFYKKRKQYQDDMLQILESVGVQVKTSTKEQYNKRLKSDNNWIQLLP